MTSRRATHSGTPGDHLDGRLRIGKCENFFVSKVKILHEKIDAAATEQASGVDGYVYLPDLMQVSRLDQEIDARVARRSAGGVGKHYRLLSQIVDDRRGTGPIELDVCGHEHAPIF